MKSRVLWLRGGDINTKYFHGATNNRRAQNRITSLVDEQGTKWFTEADLGKEAENYFKKMYASEDVGLSLDDLNLGLIMEELSLGSKQ